MIAGFFPSLSSRERKFAQRFLFAETFGHPHRSGTSRQNSEDIPGSLPRNLRKTNFRGREQTFRPPWAGTIFLAFLPSPIGLEILGKESKRITKQRKPQNEKKKRGKRKKKKQGLEGQGNFENWWLACRRFHVHPEGQKLTNSFSGVPPVLGGLVAS